MSIHPAIEYLEYPRAEDRISFLKLFDRVDQVCLVDFRKPYPLPTKMTHLNAAALLADLIDRAGKTGDVETILLIFRTLARYLEVSPIVATPTIGQAFIKAAAQGELKIIRKMRLYLPTPEETAYGRLALIEAFQNGHLQVISELIVQFKLSQTQFQEWLSSENLEESSREDQELIGCKLRDDLRLIHKGYQPKDGFNLNCIRKCHQPTVTKSSDDLDTSSREDHKVIQLVNHCLENAL